MFMFPLLWHYIPPLMVGSSAGVTSGQPTMPLPPHVAFQPRLADAGGGRVLGHLLHQGREVPNALGVGS